MTDARLAPAQRGETSIGLDDLPRFEDAVPCEWMDWTGSPCLAEAMWRAFCQLPHCDCPDHYVLLCNRHEKKFRSIFRTLTCRAHEAIVIWVKSIPL